MSKKSRQGTLKPETKETETKQPEAKQPETKETETKETEIDSQQFLTLGKYASQTIGKQYHQVVKQEKKVLEDKDPEHLHYMRVGTRRLQTALQVFSAAIELPKQASEQRIRPVAKVLGSLRDLDVQIADLQETYRPTVTGDEQNLLDQVLQSLRHQRRKVFAGVKDTLTGDRYRDLKRAYETWLTHPQYTALAQFPLIPLLPDLLSPLLASLLLHPAWLIHPDALSDENSPVLHDLRKACKHVRYQAEFFLPMYGESFQAWVDELKTIQDCLGTVQDGQVLLELLANYLSRHTKLPELRAAIQAEQDKALADWEPLRQKYIDPDFRLNLHQLILAPVAPDTPSQKKLAHSGTT